jgi:acetate kinase
VHILVINSGSSSIKFSLFEAEEREPKPLYDGEIAGIGTETPRLKFRDADGKDLNGGRDGIKAQTEVEAIALVIATVNAPGLPNVTAVGYRVVHPGSKLDRHQLITDKVLKDLDEASVFAPLHDPTVIEIIRTTMLAFPNVPHYACFDTIFHQTMPEVAKTYPLPLEYRQQGVRRYGLHGLSCESIVRQLRAEQKDNSGAIPHRMIIAHLGSGCSVTAVVDGRSVDTTMGLTPTGGVVMGTRPGDLDPGLVLYLLRQTKGDKISALEKLLNHDSGIVALSGMPNDMKAVRASAAHGDAQAKLATEVFTRSVKKAIGGFIALMGGVDALVFAGGIGENDADSREEIAGGLTDLGILINSDLNRSKSDSIRNFSASHSGAAVLVVPAKEDWMIAVHVSEMAAAKS